ncbi:class I SAM-dependent methyltransferase [Candidatus Woesearchaeota archaeon]|nr:class I SAM-dependent methyltransferase [Candidatus Woesearchaeota archaeon]
MLLNRLEFILVNNPISDSIKRIEVKKVKQLSQLPKNKVVLEIGCGNGAATRQIKRYFSPKKIYAIDLDARMIKLAKKKSKDASIMFEVRDAANLKYKNASFDAVFDFAVIHHIPNWKDCLKEIKRILKPRGEFILIDLSSDTFNTFIGRIGKKLLAHPYDQMYNEAEFIDYLKYLGFKIRIHKKYNHLGLIKYFMVIAVKK